MRASALAGNGRTEDHQAQDLEEHLGAGMGCIGGRVVLRRHLDDVAADEIDALQPADQLQNLPRRQTSDFRRTGARRETRVEAVDIEGEIGRTVADDLLRLFDDRRNTSPVTSSA